MCNYIILTKFKRNKNKNKNKKKVQNVYKKRSPNTTDDIILFIMKFIGENFTQ